MSTQRRCGILPASKGAKFICFEGAETLPGGRGSTYGTSLLRSRALDPSMDVLLAYEQNGKPLAPDHGFPVRLIIPGYIGGRMVKWLQRIEVTTEESQNHYHFHDNRVLPSHVDAETAVKEGVDCVRIASVLCSTPPAKHVFSIMEDRCSAG